MYLKIPDITVTFVNFTLVKTGSHAQVEENNTIIDKEETIGSTLEMKLFPFKNNVIRPTPSENNRKIKSLSIKERSLAERCRMYLPYPVAIFPFTFQVLLAMFCTRAHLYQLLPEELCNPLTFIFLWAQELYIGLMQDTAWIIFFQNCLLFFECTTRNLKAQVKVLRNIRPADVNVQRCFSLCKETEAHVKLFNIGYSSNIYFFKLALL
ncbi:unnamed protein product, partial [Allacma fusca]